MTRETLSRGYVAQDQAASTYAPEYPIRKGKARTGAAAEYSCHSSALLTIQNFLLVTFAILLGPQSAGHSGWGYLNVLIAVAGFAAAAVHVAVGVFSRRSMEVARGLESPRFSNTHSTAMGRHLMTVVLPIGLLLFWFAAVGILLCGL